ncbi:hypothetical protein PQJ75_28155 [Rhodoplanes sp. TEM]|uniref:Glycosyltransferase RgtA/B/C/D-like domain-containing protein n=1 Tax=Rhodoplanes tepidamans TaxID=200616 RepID=A0ABT5J3G3_RHOTP|nr:MULTISPECIES: hypothetical protein [Rhodoplanes]MDC7784195.1 hypothetical protein [Rhodoplanes tepidamans]MDC7987625.1 hypothetical protein [Rhodoplanes sp. TEM]MDQ0356707.1 hypothetical protein [Rhodoplanes tepidamans]
MPARSAVLRLGFAVLVFAALATAITSRPAKRMVDFDQIFYLTIAHDLVHHGVFANGIFDDVAGSRAPPPPGMFFAPLYPLAVAGVMRLDARFARAVDCTIAADESRRELTGCETYATPVLILHALLLALAALAIGRTGEIATGDARVFYGAAALATAGFVAEADLFSFVMTESLSVATFGLFGLTMVTALARWRLAGFAACGFALGLACLTRPTFLILAPVTLVIVAVVGRWFSGPARRPLLRPALVFAAALAAMLTPWLVRNAVSVGKPGFTEEYGSVALIERFAFNGMTAREYVWAFPACVPVVGPPVVAALAGPDATARFTWNAPGSFFEIGRGRRNALIAAHGRLDPIIGGVAREEMADGGWLWHLATSVPLAWCGLWVGGLFGLIVLPLAALGLVRAARRGKPLVIACAVPALLLVGVHGVLANHYPRYNLGLVGPMAVAAAWLVSDALARRRRTAPPRPDPGRGEPR